MHIYLQIMTDIFGMSSGLICYVMLIILKEPKNLTPGNPPPLPSFFSGEGQ